MFASKMKTKNLRKIIYIYGCLIEVVFFGMLFNFEKTINFINNLSFNFLGAKVLIIPLILIIGGWFIAVGARRIKR